MLDQSVHSEDMLPLQRKPMSVTWERSFFAALRALRHLYFQLENSGLELHSNCEVCDEIRKFLAVPNYRVDNIESDEQWKPVFLIPRDALKHLYTKLEADAMNLHSVRCLGCIEIREFLSNPEYLGKLDEPLQVDMHRPLNYAPLNWVDKDYESRSTRAGLVGSV